MALASFLLLAAACSSAPIFVPGQAPARPLRVMPGSRLLIFSFVLREVDSSKSQGVLWYTKLREEDYRKYSQRVRDLLKQRWQVELLPDTAIKESGAYRAGAFPVFRRYFLNPNLLPIVSSEREAEVMLRVAPGLGADVLALVLLDFGITKLFAQPADTESVVSVHFWSPAVGYLGAIETRAEGTATPYDRSLSLGELVEAYREPLASSVRRGFEQSLEQLDARLQQTAPPAARPAPDS